MRIRRPCTSHLIALAAVASTGAALVGVAVANAATSGFVRVDQLGYVTTETKHAFLMSTGAVSGETFQVLDAGGSAVLSGTVSTGTGSWSSTYKNVYQLDFSQLTKPGSYTIKVAGTVAATSPKFAVGSAGTLLGGRVDDTVKFFQAQRDGRDVIPGALNRKPAHTRQSAASVYKWPTFAHDDVINETSLTRIAGPVDVEGGWYDAGDYLKFTHTNAYSDGLLLIAQRELGSRASAGLRTEARFGSDWLNKVWDANSRTLYFQVGIGSGDKGSHFVGDHDVWRLPEKDDGDTQADQRYLRDFPVFRAADPGKPISPNLAGRVSAALALNAQVTAATDPAAAKAQLDKAAALYALANTANPGTLVTALPHEFYPESVWRDDMEWGGAELALAGQALNDSRATGWLTAAANWAKAYLASDSGDTLNVYDTSAVGHAELIRAIDAAGGSGLAVSRNDLVNGLKAQLEIGVGRSTKDPFRVGGNATEFDVASHTFGLAATAAMYRSATGSSGYDTFGTAQRNWVLGANAWGASMMVGVGTTFPKCVSGSIANLSGSLDGSAPVFTGAVINGPNNASIFSRGGVDPDYLDGMRKCPSGADPHASFTGTNRSKFVDDVRSWQTSEDANDFTASSALAFALTSLGNGGGTPPDTTPPSMPANLRSTGATSTSVSLAWDPSTDDTGVTGYEVFTGGGNPLTVTGTTATVTGLQPATSYTFTVRARDAAGNVSGLSASVTTATSSGGGTPVLLSQGRTASASSTESSSYAAAKAFDGSTSTRWASKEGHDPEWLRVDLGTGRTLTRVKLQWETAYGKAYQLQTSTDGTTWTTVSSTTTGNGGTDDVTIAGAGRYVRMYGTRRGTSYGYSLYEMQVYGF